MKSPLGWLRYLALVGVASCAIASLSAFGWAGFKTVTLASGLLRGHVTSLSIELVQVMDSTLIAAALLIFALGLYELFVGELGLPEGLVTRDLDALKSKLAAIVVLAMAVLFIERLEGGESAQGIFFIGAGIAAVAIPLIVMATKRHN
jgi:uncharacterized membrane protein YqhA